MLNRTDVAPYDSAVDIQTVKAMLDQRGGAARILRACNTRDDLSRALRDILATLGNTAIVPPQQLAAARDALAKATE
jgi:hypothetical protein